MPLMYSSISFENSQRTVNKFVDKRLSNSAVIMSAFATVICRKTENFYTGCFSLSSDIFERLFPAFSNVHLKNM